MRLVASDRAAFAQYLLDSLNRLAGARVDFAAITANTPHIVFDELASRAAIPLISIAETSAEEAKRIGLQKLLLLGTRFTMEGAFYPEVFARHGITVLPPNDNDRAWVHERYVTELLAGDFRDETRQEFHSLIARTRETENIGG